jgi:hypothetical protein
MSRFKDFGSGPDLSGAEPVTFKLHGETFNCRKAVQGKLLLALVANADDPVKSADAVNKFFETVLLPADYKKFEELCADPDKIISVDTLAEVAAWLVAEYTNRPTQRPEASPTGA